MVPLLHEQCFCVYLGRSGTPHPPPLPFTPPFGHREQGHAMTQNWPVFVSLPVGVAIQQHHTMTQNWQNFVSLLVGVAETLQGEGGHTPPTLCANSFVYNGTVVVTRGCAHNFALNYAQTRFATDLGGRCYDSG